MGNVTGIVLAGTCATLLLTGCGLIGGGNKDTICQQATVAFDRFASSVRSAPPTDKARWKQSADAFAARMDALAGQAEDAKLKKALQDESADARTAGSALATGDAAPLQRLVTATPARVGAACA
ncbi:hypothetical protein DPM19_28265 [Actinomadura craniellae]|uniref:Uncharacterized protein n=1 Tax=Actinomadura craniellae TaxID=2231787 RepID=A0A365GYF2_9ACTN|nr:hypothetical protein [Actinomadura craniellae]RAY11870.1 hypothetical protein DPM19_28265 [Actinomadura craniellae]